MFSGALSDFNLAQVLDLLHASNQSGELVLRRGEARVGSVYLQVGQLTHASAGQFEGLDALNQLIASSDASFSFDSGVLPVDQSLAAYPTDRLLDRLRKQVESLRQLVSSAPPADARPVYKPVSGSPGISATPMEVGLLLLATGQRTIAEIAHLGGVSVRSAAETMKKFQQSNLISLNEKPHLAAALGFEETAPPPILPVEKQIPTPPEEPKAPLRYWRGRLIK